MGPEFSKQTSENWMTVNARVMEASTLDYHRWNLGVFGIAKNARILDIGCGPGIYFDAIMEYAPQAYVGVDYSPAYIDLMKAKIAARPGCEAFTADLLQPGFLQNLRTRSFDYLFCFDVLEHLPDDGLALTHIRRFMTDSRSARLLLRVPALQAIYGRNDEAIGHHRRYSRAGLRALLERCGFKVLTLRYQNLPGIVPWYVTGRIRKRSQALTRGEGRLFNLAVPVIRTLESLVPPPLGLSLYAVCE